MSLEAVVNAPNAMEEYVRSIWFEKIQDQNQRKI